MAEAVLRIVMVLASQIPCNDNEDKENRMLFSVAAQC